MANRHKQAAYAAEPPVPKKARYSRYPTEQKSADLIAWRIGDVELAGPWPFSVMSLEQAQAIHRFLSEMEKRTWEDACFGKPVRQVRVRDAPEAVRKRLEETKRDDVDCLAELLMGGLPRIWGVRRGNACHLLWWDPEHKVWPSPKRRT